MRARSSPNSDGHPANKTSAIDFNTVNGRIRYAFGTVINAKLPEGLKDSKLAKGMRLLWPHMSKDLENVDQAQLLRGAMFVDLMMQMCIHGAPENMPFDEYLEAVMNGKLNVTVGRMQLLPAAPVAVADESAS